MKFLKTLKKQLRFNQFLKVLMTWNGLAYCDEQILALTRNRSLQSHEFVQYFNLNYFVHFMDFKYPVFVVLYQFLYFVYLDVYVYLWLLCFCMVLPHVQLCGMLLRMLFWRDEVASRSYASNFWYPC